MSIKMRRKSGFGPSLCSSRNPTLTSVTSAFSSHVPGVDTALLKKTWHQVGESQNEEDKFALLDCQKLFYNKLFELIPEIKPLFPTINEQANMFSGLIKQLIKIEEYFDTAQTHTCKTILKKTPLPKPQSVPSTPEPSRKNSVSNLDISRTDHNHLNSAFNISNITKERRASLSTAETQSDSLSLSALSLESTGSINSVSSSQLLSAPSTEFISESVTTILTQAGNSETVDSTNVSPIGAMTHDAQQQFKTLGKVHSKLGITPDMYDAVWTALLAVIKSRMADSFNDNISTAWKNAFEIYSSLMVSGTKRKSFNVQTLRRSSTMRKRGPSIGSQPKITQNVAS